MRNETQPKPLRTSGPGRETKLHPLAFRVWRELEGQVELTGARVLLACSGGVDSMACLSLLMSLRARLDFELEVASVHHGPHHEPRMQEYRHLSLRSVADFCTLHELRFHALEHGAGDEPLQSEAQYRDFRLRKLAELRSERKCQYLVFAHHADDLLETRMIRLIRGTGQQGLEAMRLEKNGILRPLLKVSRDDLVAYATEQALSWREDPSNAERGPLRNWLRQEWLPELQRKRPGSLASLARSFDHLIAGEDVAQSPQSLKQVVLSQSVFRNMSLRKQSSELAAILLTLGVRDFGSAHVEEILKRFKSHRVRRFQLLDLLWQFDAEQIVIRRIGEVFALEAQPQALRVSKNKTKVSRTAAKSGRVT